MPQYLFAYHGGKKPQTPEEGEKAMAEWGAWFQNMGDAIVVPGNPVGQSMTVSAQGMAGDGGANPVSGFTVIRADTHQAACDLAKGCPMVADGTGSVEVAEIMEM
ncbi:hypothetical protein ACFORG_00565 [Lutimaribacter marinistellae]|uniref:YCII-related domain-containing protein n=1 Tax=Lutimaribacter marinistellae TaxID=1820329 RepID=A0ABV7TAR3_9RHOB